MPPAAAKTYFACLLTVLAIAVACGGAPPRNESTGSLHLNLELAGGTQIDHVSYVISGNDIIPISGTIDTSAAGATASAEVFGIPGGEDYLVDMAATSADGETACEGSAAFDVRADEVTTVMVMLNCAPLPRFGSARVDGTFNVCADLQKVVVSPLETSAGSEIDVLAVAADLEDDPVEYHWTSTGGSFVDPHASDTSFVCGAVGAQTIAIAVSDDGFSNCVGSWTVQVLCAGPPVDYGKYLYTCLLPSIPIPLPVGIQINALDPGFRQGDLSSLTTLLSYSVAPSVINLLPALAPDAVFDIVDCSVGVSGGTPASILHTAEGLPLAPVGEFDSDQVTTEVTPTGDATELSLALASCRFRLSGLPSNLVPGGVIDLVAGEDGCGPIEAIEGSGPLTFPVESDGMGGTGGTGGSAGTGGDGGGGAGGAAGSGGIGGSAGEGGHGGMGGMPSGAVIPYDRTDPLRMAPFPDDNWLVPYLSKPTGYRVSLTPPAREADVQFLYAALMNETASLDGFSPIGGIVIQLSAAPDVNLLPLTPQASLEPSAAVALFDLTAGSETFGQRVPFQLTPISRALESQEIDHCLVLYPSIPLRSKGRYAVVVTRDGRAEDGRSFEPSLFMTAVLGSEEPGEAIQITHARELLSDGVLDVLADEGAVSPPIEASDIALVFRITVRSTDDIPLTPLSMKAQILSRPPPSYAITSVSPGVGPVAAVVRGTWQAPNWRENQYFISRDENGDPQITGSLSVDFVLALPEAALSGPVPVVMFQHGSPGSAEQVYAEALGSLAEAGLAVIGFTDTLNRELGQDLDYQNQVLFQTLIAQFRFPHFPMQTYGEQMAFLRVIEQLGTLDQVPLPSGDGVPDLDLGAPLTYVGLSMGSVHGSAFLPYAPEIKAAALSAGAQRQAEQYFNRGAFIDSFPPALKALLPHATPLDYWVGLSIFQMVFDHQDAHHHASHLYRDRLQVAGTMRKASVLLAEGVGDTRMPNSLTRSLAWTFGPIPHLQPIWESTPILEPITGPVTANIDSETTAAFYQFVPAGIPGIPPTPGCTGEPEGHYCAQDAAEARRQRASFLRSAIEDPVPTITDPLSVAP